MKSELEWVLRQAGFWLSQDNVASWKEFALKNLDRAVELLQNPDIHSIEQDHGP